MMKNSVLVFVRDRISGVPETQIMQMMTSAHAIKGFIEFCKKDGIAKEEHELVMIAELDEENHVDICQFDPHYTNERILCNGNNAEKIYEELTRSLREDSDLLEA